MNAPLSHRREFLKTTSSGFGYLAFAALAHQQALRANPAAGPLMPKATAFHARAKHVIFLCMQGAPSHVDTFDYKPKLIADAGKSAPSAAGRYGTGETDAAASGNSAAWQERPVDLRVVAESGEACG
jgi:hypothetical protein